MDDTIKFKCSRCGSTLEVDISGAGKTIKCLNCSQPTTAPLPPPITSTGHQLKSPPPVSQTTAQAEKQCPFCGESILAIAKKCKHCGSMLDGSEQHQTTIIKGIDPFAEYHTPIQCKKNGKLTFIGYVGLVLGVLIMFAGCSILASNGEKGSDFLAFRFLGFGAFIGVGAYLWARR